MSHSRLLLPVITVGVKRVSEITGSPSGSGSPGPACGRPPGSRQLAPDGQNCRQALRQPVSRQDRSTALRPLALARRGGAITRLRARAIALGLLSVTEKSLLAVSLRPRRACATKATPPPVKRRQAISHPRARGTEARP